MKGKKRKKGTNSNYKNSASVRAQSAESVRINEEVRSRKRMKTIARNILLADLVMLAVTQLLTSFNKISNTTSSILCMLGIVLLCIALWVQFGKHGEADNTRAGKW